MKETVVITAMDRPEFLHACLMRLERADNRPEHYVISLDRKHTNPVENVARDFKKRNPGTEILSQRHQYRGNSYNTLHALKYAVESGAELVYLVEDDIIIGKDFFPFHRRSHELVPNNLSVSACRNQFFAFPNDPPPEDTVIYDHLSYQSLGVSFQAPRLRRILSEVEYGYFRDPVGFCQRKFPNSRINPNHAEQDGLIHRIGERDQLPTVYGFVPRAYHAGFYGYHRNGARLTGGVRERAYQILAMSTEQMNEKAHTYKDHVVVDLDGDRSDVSCVKTFP